MAPDPARPAPTGAEPLASPAPAERPHDERRPTEQPERRRLRLRPRPVHAGLVAGLAVAAWLSVAFAGVVTEAAAVNEDAAAVRREIAELEARLEAGRREVALIQSDAFIRHGARAFGFGEPRERPFGLRPGAPPPPRITPLGAPPPAQPTTPLEDWLRLLFGR